MHGVYSKIAEKRIFLIFVDSDLNLCKASQVCVFSSRAHASLHGSLWKFGWWYKISFGPEIFLKILYLNSSLSCVVYQKIDCTLTKLLSERELSFAVWLREVCTFDRQCLFWISSDINSSVTRPNALCRAYYFKL